MDKAEAIIITVPERFWNEYPGGEEAFEKEMSLISEGDGTWMQTISNIPIQQVEFCYLIIHGKVTKRLTIHKYHKNKTMTFMDGGIPRTMENKNWVSLCGPVINAPMEIIRKGFQGFRYTKLLF